MLRKPFILFFLQILLPITCCGFEHEKSMFNREIQSLTAEESVILDRFFRALIEEAEAGYVLYDQKPVCAHAFFSNDMFLVNSPWHANSVALKEGAPIWKQLSPEAKNSKFTIFINEKEEARLPGWIHLFVINRPLFLKTVQDNFSLFQYALGPTVTPENLLKSITNSFNSSLHEDKALIGLILGYGRENALCVSRIEYISEYLNAAEDIPFRHNVISQEDQLRGFFLPPPGSRYAFKAVTPSCGFKTLEEELSALESQIKVSSEKLETVVPQFIFGHLSDSSSSKLVASLEKTQDKIQSFLKSDNFLQAVLKAFLNKEILVSNPSNYKLCFDRIEINKIIAQGIWQEELQECDSDFIPYFINAITELNVQDNEDDLLHLPSILKDITKTQQNLTKTTAFFESLEHQQEINCIVHKKLYYKTLEAGDSSSVCTSPKVRLNFAFFDPLCRPLKCQSDAVVNLNSTISGFSYAVKGMRKGETREIYVHPSLAYGIYTPYEKGIYLRAVVTLLDVEKTDEPFAELANMDVSFLENQDFLNSVKDRYKKTLVWRAHLLARHLHKSKDIDMELIKQYLQELWQGKIPCSKLTPAEEALINKVHWNIYFGVYEWGGNAIANDGFKTQSKIEASEKSVLNEVAQCCYTGLRVKIDLAKRIEAQGGSGGQGLHLVIT